MALAHAILTALSHEPLSGYDLAKAFKTSTGYFWRATRQQIYAELRRLEEKAMIAGTRHEQDKLPDKVIWSITPDGAAALKTWLDTPSQPASIKEELLVKLYALEFADLRAFREQLLERAGYHEERLKLFLAIERKISAAGQLGTSETGRLLGVRSGIHYEQGMLDWAREALAMVDRLLADQDQSPGGPR